MPEEGKILDIAHISFLDMIKIMIEQIGPASAKGTLVRNALKTAENISEVDYPTFDDYLQAIEDVAREKLGLVKPGEQLIIFVKGD